MLKVFEPEDVNSAKSFWGDEEVMQYCLGATPHELLSKTIDYYIKCHEEQGLSVYAVVEKESEQVIGAAGLNLGSSTESVELIFHLNKDSWGKGYATEAATACVDIAKRHNSVEYIYASANPINTGSLKVLEKIGLKYQGMKWFDDVQEEEAYYEMHLE
ncbi:N-acetyltransferase [Filobacillus milosensis]|uniref:N-acetyltransferase n=1 Tax=Filobacillus milosensis TaxID=94137 RepID=A0A4Y8ISJ8_9BACI|nr:GNAT family N-acetyltransferase [Filobacillus milosensis]TFB23903.1 N-acetyltransferase [Filobacillus milosensis]